MMSSSYCRLFWEINWAHQGALTFVNPAGAASSACTSSLGVSLLASTPWWCLWRFLCFWYFSAKLLFVFIKQINLDQVQSDQTNMVYSLFYSMTDCQGKDSASFFNLLQYRTVWLSKLISIVLLLGMIPVGRVQQTNHLAAPALTQGERRGWLLWTNKSKTPPPKTTRRSFLLLNKHSPTRMLDEWTNIMSGWVVKLRHSAPVRRHFLRLHKN